MTTPEHGTLTAYSKGCTCDACITARHRYTQRRDRLIAYGQWRPYTDATPVRDHLTTLAAAGLGGQQVANLTGLDYVTIVNITTRRARKVRPTTATAILALRADLDTLAPGAYIDATGTRRRIQALIASGWGNVPLAKRLGVHPTTVYELLRATRVRVSTARRVRTVYTRLENTPPPQETSRDRWVVRRARSRAATHGWLPPAAWDDDWLDLPDHELQRTLATLAAQMSDAETARCHTAYQTHGDRTPLTVAAAREHRRRRAARRRTRQDTAA